MKRFTSSVSPKGQVTIPAEVRKRLHISPRDRVTFEVEGDEIRLVSGAFTVKSAHASIPALDPLITYEEMERRAKEDRVLRLIAEMNEQ